MELDWATLMGRADTESEADSVSNVALAGFNLGTSASLFVCDEEASMMVEKKEGIEEIRKYHFQCGPRVIFTQFSSSSGLIFSISFFFLYFPLRTKRKSGMLITRTFSLRL